MFDLRIDSISPPLNVSGEAAGLALALVARAQTMGFLPEADGKPVELDRRFVLSTARLLREEGVAAGATHALERALETEPVDARRLGDALRATIAAVDASPRPQGEWRPAREVLGDDLLARLLGVSASSLHRYATGERRTPDDVAWRLHVIARLLAALLGSYNDYGIRRWFDRRRTALDGGSPGEVLRAAESEDDAQLQRAITLAEALVGVAGAT